jgi:hypothetical protein
MSSTPDYELVHDEKAGFGIRVVRGRELRFQHLDWPSRELRGEVTLPYPRHGYGGAVLSLAPASDHAAVLLYSGQSETGYELFSLVPSLRHVGGMAYVAGESDLSPITFSSDGRLAALAVEKPTFWWADPTDEDADWETPSAGGLVEWATLYVHALGEQAPVELALRVNVPKGWYPGGDGAGPERLRFVDRSTLVIGVPWASDFRFALPSGGDGIVVPSPKGPDGTGASRSPR